MPHTLNRPGKRKRNRRSFTFGKRPDTKRAVVTLHAGDRGYGILLTAWGAGVVLGSLVFARSLRRPLGAMLGGGTLAAGLAYVGFAVAPSLLLACLAALIGGIGNGVETPMPIPSRSGLR